MEQRRASRQAARSRAPGDSLLVVGVALVAIGFLATVATLVPLLADSSALPLPFYLLSLLAPVGLGVILVTLWRRARARGLRLRQAHDHPGDGRTR